MADVTLTPQDLLSAGVTVTRTAISTGNTYQILNNGQVILNFRKTGANLATITITTPRTEDGLAVDDLVIEVPATTGDIVAAFFPETLFNSTDGEIEFTTDEGTALTCAVFRGLGS